MVVDSKANLGTFHSTCLTDFDCCQLCLIMQSFVQQNTTAHQVVRAIASLSYSVKHCPYHDSVESPWIQSSPACCLLRENYSWIYLCLIIKILFTSYNQHQIMNLY